MQKTLFDIAYARSGDKGGNANIGLIAYTLEGYNFIESYVTEIRLLNFFKGLPIEKIEKYPLPNLWAINYVLKGALGEGGSNSLRIDSQGKVLGQALLEMPIPLSDDLLDLCKRGPHG